MKQTRLFSVLGALLFPVMVAVLANGCSCKGNETEDLPPTPSAVPTPEPTPPPPAVVAPEEDAGLDAGDDAADGDGGKKATGSGDPTGVKKCCAALRQNANSAPAEQKGGYLAAAAACDGMVNSPQGRQALSSLRGILRGAQMPAACQ